VTELEEIIHNNVSYFESRGMNLYVEIDGKKFGRKGARENLILQENLGSRGIIELYAALVPVDFDVLGSFRWVLMEYLGLEEPIPEVKLDQLISMITTLGKYLENPRKLIKVTLEIFAGILGAEAGAFFLWNEQDKKFLECYVAYKGAGGKIEGQRVPIDMSLVGLVVKMSCPILVDDVSKHPQHFDGFYEYYPVSNVMAIPVVGRYGTIGAMEFVNKPGSFSLDDLILTSSLGKTIGVIIENSIIQWQIKQILNDALAALVEATNARTRGAIDHSRRVHELAVKMAEVLGIEGDELEDLKLAALVFDVGKIGVSDRILNKKGSLSEEEWEEIKKHVIFGEEILRQVEGVSEGILKVVKYHHERWDGSGYPEGLAGDNIPLHARIVGLLDAFCAMTEERPYRRRLEPAKALSLIKESNKFDPQLVKILENVIKDTGG